MGCVCGKSKAIDDRMERPRGRPSRPSVPNPRAPQSEPDLRRKGRHQANDRLDNGVRSALVDGSARVQGENLERKREKNGSTSAVHHHPKAGMIPRASEGEQVAAGWPPWLAAVAGESIKGWLPRRADSFEKLGKIGQGTYSNVYRARDLDTGKIVALKKVRFDNLEPESVSFMAREIHILRRLDHPNVIKLEGLVTSRMSSSLYLVFEYMEHDLVGLESRPDLKFTEPQIKCYMKQLLLGLEHCHSCGVLHRDIKGSNLLIDNNGILKIADFGLASLYEPHQTQPLTSRVVTLWYRPPELLLGATYYGTSVDLWSSGCILAELYAGKPIMSGRTEVEQLHKIFKLCGSPSEEYWRKSKLPHATVFKPKQPYPRRVSESFKDFPAPALGLLEILLSIDPRDRGSAASALKSEFFTAKPHPCDPSTLPKYPPSKEFDAKIREEEEMRQATAGSKGQRSEPKKVGPRESGAFPAPDANAELVSSMQKRHGQPNPKSKSEKFNSHPEEAASGFPIDPPQPSHSMFDESNGNFPKRASHSGPLVNRDARTKARKNTEGGPKNLAMGPKAIPRFRGSFKEGSNLRRRGQKNNGQHEDSSSDNPVPMSQVPNTMKIHYSGPLLVPSGKVDQVLKDRDRHFQEAVRHARLVKEKTRKAEVGRKQLSTDSLSGR